MPNTGYQIEIVNDFATYITFDTRINPDAYLNIEALQDELTVSFDENVEYCIDYSGV